MAMTQPTATTSNMEVVTAKTETDEEKVS